MSRQCSNMRCDDDVTVTEEDGGFMVCDGNNSRLENPLTVPLANVKERPIDWLWENRIPTGMVTLIEGAENVGKSFITLSIAAGVSRGNPFYDGPQKSRSAGHVLLVGDRDGIEQTVLPRLKQMGANLRQCLVYSDMLMEDVSSDAKGRRRCQFPFDFVQLKSIVRKHQSRLVVIDTLADFCPLRQIPEALRQLQSLAAELQISILVTSCNAARRDRQGRVQVRTLKSYSAIRNAWCVIDDPQDPLLKHFVPTRMPFCEAPIGIAFRIKKGIVAWQPLPPPPIDPRELMLQDAEQWLREELASGGLPARQVQADARECGISSKQLYEARHRLGAQTMRIGAGSEGGWWWQLASAAQEPDLHKATTTTEKTPDASAAKSERQMIISPVGGSLTELLSGKALAAGQPYNPAPPAASALPLTGDCQRREAELVKL